MPRYKPGTLVRVKTTKEILDETGDEPDYDLLEVIEEHGRLHVVVAFNKEGSLTEDDEYHCKSLSTGKSVYLFNSEITTKEQDNE